MSAEKPKDDPHGRAVWVNPNSIVRMLETHGSATIYDSESFARQCEPGGAELRRIVLANLLSATGRSTRARRRRGAQR